MDAEEVPPCPSLEQYRKQAKEFFKAFLSLDPHTLTRVRRHHPRFQSETESSFTLADAQLVIAREHGFLNWANFVRHIEALNDRRSPTSKFELAADAVVTGDVNTLQQLLRGDSRLVKARSSRRHRATLLHYVSANGVEDFRQKSPANAVAVAETLLKSGAEVDASADSYSGGANQTTLNWLVSSTHPAKAGVQSSLVEELLRYGAAINGPENDSSPLRTALAFHYPQAAETLARQGARVDTIAAAAGLGYVDLVEQLLTKATDQEISLAFVWAAMHDRRAVVELLLKRGVNPGVVDHRSFTALHWAALYGNIETLQLLLQWNAPLEMENEFGATPLGQVIWTTIHEPFLPSYALVVKLLVNAGARIDSKWREPAFQTQLAPEISAALCR